MRHPLVVVGSNYGVAPIDVRERLAITKIALPEILTSLRDAGIPEVYVLSTCNRTEVCAVNADPAVIVRQLAERAGLDEDILQRSVYVHAGADAVHHLFTVAAGLDSMIVGEVEILGQIRTALAVARREHTLGKTLDRLVCSALATGKRVRSETDISTRAASVSNAAFELARTDCGTLDAATVLVLGAGEIAESAARVFASHQPQRMLFANRTAERSRRLAGRYGGEPVSYLNVHEWLSESDVVITATDAPHVVVRSQQVRHAMAHRTDRRLCIIDLAVPRDVEASVGLEPNVHLYNIDDLQNVVERNLDARRASAGSARRVVEEEVEAFMAWYRGLCAVPTVRRFRDRAEAERRTVLKEFDGRLGTLTPEQRATIEEMTLRLTHRLVHRPTVGLKAAASRDGTHLHDAAMLLLGEPGDRARS